jgi:hypothetical protein
VTPEIASDLIIKPPLKWLGEPYDSLEAVVMLIAIGMQESHFSHRTQSGGPARGLWQFEVAGGCAEFEMRPELAPFRKAAQALNFPISRARTAIAIGQGADTLACIMARSVLWLEKKPLPEIGDEEEAWRQYLRRWRPGKPSRSRWTTTSYPAALKWR